MGYVHENLLPGEQVEYEARLHWIVFAPAVLLLVVAFVFFFLGTRSEEASFATGIGGFFVLAAVIGGLNGYIKKAGAEFAVTNRRVLIKVGFLGRRTLELLLHKVEGIGVEQSLAGQMLGFGTISVTGTGGTRERFEKIADPLEFRRHVQQHAMSLSVEPQARASALSPTRATGPFCTQCGTRNPDGARFCNKCGTQLVA